MKATGIVRSVDSLGRLVLPMELRKVLGVNRGTPLEIYVGGQGEVILKKYEPLCCFCGGNDKLTVFKGKQVCVRCIMDLQA